MLLIEERDGLLRHITECDDPIKMLEVRGDTAGFQIVVGDLVQVQHHILDEFILLPQYLDGDGLASVVVLPPLSCWDFVSDLDLSVIHDHQSSVLQEGVIDHNVLCVPTEHVVPEALFKDELYPESQHLEVFKHL